MCSIFAAAAVSFTVAALLMKAQTSTEQDGDKDALVKATSIMQEMKAGSKGQAAPTATQSKKIDMANVQSIIVACDAGMGSSAMGASMLRKKIQEVGLPVTVTNMAINSLPAHVDMVITHQDLTDRARQHAPNAEHISLNNFLDSALYNQLVTQLLAAKRQAANDSQLIKPRFWPLTMTAMKYSSQAYSNCKRRTFTLA